MTVISTTPDLEGLRLVVEVDLPATPPRVWQLWADPRQLERWWGPPTWPATFLEHEVVVGGSSHYFMTGPGGEKIHGWWRYLAVEEPWSLELQDGFAHDNGTPDPAMPITHMQLHLVEVGAGTRMTVTSQFPSAEAMQQMLDMGMAEGMTAAMGQLDEVLTTS